MIRALCFDLDDTLLDNRHAERVGLEALHAAFAHRLPGLAETMATWSAAIIATWPRFMNGEITLQEARRVRLRRVFGDEGLSAGACDERYAIYSAIYQRHWRLFPDTVAALDAVSHLPLAIITNGQSPQQIAKLRACGILARFSQVVTPDIADSGKPRAEIFHYACRALGCPPQEAMHIGDHPGDDVGGAIAAGLQAVWLDRDDRGGHPTSAARITTLVDLAGIRRVGGGGMSTAARTG